MDDSLANDLAYLEGKISVALRRDADKKLKCKQGYVQRGSACKKVSSRSKNTSLNPYPSNQRKIPASFSLPIALSIATGVLASVLKSKTSQKELKNATLDALIENGFELQGDINGKDAVLRKAVKPLVLTTGVATGLFISKEVAEASVLKAMGIRVETHSTSRKNAKKIEEEGYFLDPSKGGTGASTISEETIKTSSGYIHITGIHPKFKDHDAVFLRTYEEGSSSPKEGVEFYGWIKKDDKTDVFEKFGAEVREKVGSEVGYSLSRESMPSNSLLGYLVGKSQRLMYSGFSELSEEERRKPPVLQLLSAYGKSLTGKGGKTFYVADTEDFFRDNFVPDSDDLALKTQKRIKVFSSKYEAVIDAYKRKKVKTDSREIPKYLFTGIKNVSSEDLLMLGALIVGIKAAEGTRPLTKVAKIDAGEDLLLLSNSAYLEGRSSVALRRDADKKLKCKQGYVQRGSACQKIEVKRGANLARDIGVGLGAAALAGSVAAIAANKSNRQSTPAQPSPATKQPQPKPQVVKAPESKAKRRLAIAAGVATVSYLGATAISRADKDGEIAAVASLLAVSPILIKSDQIDRAIASSPLSSKTKKDAENLVGATKLMLMKKIIMGSGYDLESVDKDNNSFTYKSKKTGDIQTVGSAGSALLVFNSAPTKKDGNTFKMGFQVNIGFNRNSERSVDTSKALIKMAGAAFQEHLKLLPDNCVVGCLVADDDGAGSKRGAIYKRAGFAPVPEAGNLDLYAVKVDGELKKIKTDEDKKLVIKMAKG